MEQIFWNSIKLGIKNKRTKLEIDEWTAKEWELKRTWAGTDWLTASIPPFSDSFILLETTSVSFGDELSFPLSLF